MPLQPLILGIIQGLTEFLPISSSGHLFLVPKLFGWAEQGMAFDATIHLATLAAVFVALWVDVKAITLGIFRRDEKGKLGWLILVATLPVLLVGFFFNDWFETVFRSPLAVAASLAGWGAVLWIADALLKKTAEGKLEKIGWQRTLLICLSQIIAFIPGTSRSGITITAGLFSGLTREAAARFSFLLGIPAIAAAGGYSLLKILYGSEAVDWSALTIAFVAAFVSGLLAIKFLLKIMCATSYKWFAIYRIVLAMVILLFFL